MNIESSKDLVPGAVIAGPIQIGMTWVRIVVSPEGDTARDEIFDGHSWRKPRPEKGERSFTLFDILEEQGWGCPCEECWLNG